jgi:hypothetical protein
MLKKTTPSITEGVAGKHGVSYVILFGRRVLLEEPSNTTHFTIQGVGPAPNLNLIITQLFSKSKWFCEFYYNHHLQNNLKPLY